ncbi:ABC transporter substrate-binding protein [Streptomyces lydicus]|uniref:ABC transporter substrate-binding protein n=1 Tax=Streptomyces lydicus TaxID=47763 RepID=UPI0036E80EAA
MAIATAFLSAVALTSCEGAEQATDRLGIDALLQNGRTFTLALASAPGNLDPVMSALPADSQLSNLTYDRLLSMKADGGIQSWVARNWSGTTTEARFTLRSGVRCSDGSMLKASDVAAGLNFLGDPTHHAALTGLVVPPGLKATGDDGSGTVRVISPRPDSFLVRNVGSVPLICAKALRDRSLLTHGSYGTGLFVLKSYQPGKRYVFERRRNYAWGPGRWDRDQRGLPSKVVVRVVPDDRAVADLVARGKVNAAVVRGSAQERLVRPPLNLKHRDVEVPLGVLTFNEAAGNPTSERAVRQALVQGADLEKVGQLMTGNQAVPTDSVAGMSPAACTESQSAGNALPFDVAAAESALDDAGWTVGTDGIRTKDGQRLRVVLNNYPAPDAQINAGVALLEKQWRTIGVETVRNDLDPQELRDLVADKLRWDAGLAQMQLNLPSNLVPFFSGPMPPRGNNFSHIANSDYERLVRAAEKLPDRRSCGRWKDAERALIDRVDLMPFVNTVNRMFFYKADARLVRGIVDGPSIRMYKMRCPDADCAMIK